LKGIFYAPCFHENFVFFSEKTFFSSADNLLPDFFQLQVAIGARSDKAFFGLFTSLIIIITSICWVNSKRRLQSFLVMTLYQLPVLPNDQIRYENLRIPFDLDNLSFLQFQKANMKIHGNTEDSFFVKHLSYFQKSQTGKRRLLEITYDDVIEGSQIFREVQWRWHLLLTILLLPRTYLCEARVQPQSKAKLMFLLPWCGDISHCGGIEEKGKNFFVKSKIRQFLFL